MNLANSFMKTFVIIIMAKEDPRLILVSQGLYKINFNLLLL